MCNYITAHATVFISFALTLHRCTIFFSVKILTSTWQQARGLRWQLHCWTPTLCWGQTAAKLPLVLKKRKRSSVRCNCSQVFSPTCVPMCWTRGANEITLRKFNIRQDNLELPETSIIKGLQDWVGKCYSELLTWAWDGSVAEVSWGCTMHLYSQCVCFTLACCAGVMTTLRRSWQWCLLHLWGQRIWKAKVGEFS